MLEPNSELEVIFEYAVKSAMKRNHEYITLEHFLYSLVSDAKFGKRLEEFGTNVKTLRSAVEKHIDEQYDIVTTDPENKPRKTHSMERMLNRAFTQVLFTGRSIIDPIDCFISLFSEKKSHAAYYIREANIDKDAFLEFISTEKAEETESGNNETVHAHLEKVIVQFCTNLNAKVKQKKIDPVIGREKEIEDIQLVLARRQKSNVMMIGEPGVGKTAIAEGLARKIVEGSVPKYIKEHIV